MTDTFRALCAELADRLQVAITSRRADANYHEDRDAVDRARAALDKPELPAITPIPVSERLPGAEDCDEKGRCWHAFLLFDDPTWTLDDYNCIPRLGSTHWLPAHVLPLPTGDEA